jgi:hypothetical protein
MMKTGTLNTLELMSKEEGKHMDSPESVKVLIALRPVCIFIFCSSIAADQRVTCWGTHCI